MSTVATPMYEWKTLPWNKIERKIFKLQKRIYQASLRGDVRTVRRLQRLLMKSWYARCLAVRRVSQDNRGKKTAGVDGVKSLTPKQRLKLTANLKIGFKASPVRRIWVPKPNKKEGRPLGIPTMANRATQTLVKFALEPEWEARFEPNSYGFRPGRSTHDAIEAIFNAISRKPCGVWDADICKCFDNIDQKTLLDKISTFPALRRIIKGWLKAGMMEDNVFHPTNKGTPQGSPLSPLLMNITLHGLETSVTSALPPRKWQGKHYYSWRPRIIRYADDMVILHHDLKALHKATEKATDYLKVYGLEIKAEKTRITHTLNKYEGNIGFDFLGFHVRQYPAQCKQGFKTLIKPSRDAIKRHLAKIRNILRTYRHASQEELIKKLNAIIRGWANYHRSQVSSREFSRLDHILHQNLTRWSRRKHPRTGRFKIAKKYWRDGRFMTKEGIELLKHSSFHIKRHIKVQNEKSPFDGDFVYWATRMGRNPLLDPRKAKLLKEQEGKCPWCGLYFKHGDILEIDHITALQLGGARKWDNLQLLHGHCHDDKTATESLLEVPMTAAELSRSRVTGNGHARF